VSLAERLSSKQQQMTRTVTRAVELIEFVACGMKPSILTLFLSAILGHVSIAEK
jgi:hypothetical protein